MLIFLKGSIMAAFVVSSLTALLWRVYSEILRADYRGKGRASVYQIFPRPVLCTRSAALRSWPIRLFSLICRKVLRRFGIPL